MSRPTGPDGKEVLKYNTVYLIWTREYHGTHELHSVWTDRLRAEAVAADVAAISGAECFWDEVACEGWTVDSLEPGVTLLALPVRSPGQGGGEPI